MAKWYGEVIEIAKRSIEAIHAMEDWLSKLPHDVKKQVYSDPHPEIVWETKKSEVIKKLIDPKMDCAPSVRYPKPKPGKPQSQTAPSRPQRVPRT